MNMYDETYRIGYEEGVLIGRIETLVYFVKKLISKNVTDNYEEAIRLLDISENDCARMMDYLPIRNAEWRLLPAQEVSKEKHNLKKL